MTNKVMRAILLVSTVLGPIGLAQAAEVTLTIESWRNDDLAIWQEKIIPAFEANNPGIKVRFTPSAPAEYNAVLNSKLAAGSAGDMITCRPFDASLSLYDKGHLAPVQGLDGMKNFSNVAKSGWSTDDGTVTYCVPMASVIHGFIYNADAFTEIGVEVPKTEAEFFAALDKIKADGNYIPMAMGTNDQWEAATMGYNNIGPNFWKGEEGRPKQQNAPSAEDVGESTCGGNFKNTPVIVEAPKIRPMSQTSAASSSAKRGRTGARAI